MTPSKTYSTSWRTEVTSIADEQAHQRVPAEVLVAVIAPIAAVTCGFLAAFATVPLAAFLDLPEGSIFASADGFDTLDLALVGGLAGWLARARRWPARWWRNGDTGEADMSSPPQPRSPQPLNDTPTLA